MTTPLESLLSLKRWREDEAKNQFAVLLRELIKEEQNLHRTENQYSAVSERLESSMSELVNIDEIKRLNEYLGSLLIKSHLQRGVISEKERLVKDARKLLVGASTEKKIIERLNDKRKTLIEDKNRRNEQAVTDESVAAGHIRKTRFLAVLSG